MKTILLQNCRELTDKVTVLLREEWPSSSAVKVTSDVRKFPVRVVCVTSEGEVVGHVKTIDAKNKDTVKLCSLVVKKEYRNRGIGRKLVECAEREAIRRGFASVILRTSEKLASSFYRSAGYRIEMKGNSKYKYDADPESNIWMHRTLRPSTSIYMSNIEEIDQVISKDRVLFEDTFVRDLHVMHMCWIQDSRYEYSALCSLLVLMCRSGKQTERHVRSRHCPARCSRCRETISINVSHDINVSSYDRNMTTRRHTHTDERIRDLRDLESVAKENSFKNAHVVSNINESIVESRVRSGIPIILAYLADATNTRFRPMTPRTREDSSPWCVHFGIVVGVARDSKDNLLAIVQHSSSRKQIVISWSDLMCSNACVDRAANTSALSSRALLLNE